MTRPNADDLQPGDYVWIAHTWPRPIVFHARAGRNPDREITIRVWEDGLKVEKTGVIAGWAFTRCGLMTYYAKWQPEWSELQTPNRFALGDVSGHDLPLRLLNPAETRPCRRCFDTASD